MGENVRLTERDRKTIRRALNDAMDDRASFAGAYGYVGPEAEGALAQVREYERLHVKMFGEASYRAREIERMKQIPRVSITELTARKPEPSS